MVGFSLFGILLQDDRVSQRNRNISGIAGLLSIRIPDIVDDSHRALFATVGRPRWNLRSLRSRNHRAGPGCLYRSGLFDYVVTPENRRVAEPWGVQDWPPGQFGRLHQAASLRLSRYFRTSI